MTEKAVVKGWLVEMASLKPLIALLLASNSKPDS